jgi:hypothetical protein
MEQLRRSRAPGAEQGRDVLTCFLGESDQVLGHLRSPLGEFYEQENRYPSTCQVSSVEALASGSITRGYLISPPPP